MATVKVIEVMSQSNKSWEDAAQQALRDASKSVNNIQSLWIKDMQAVVENNHISAYRLNAKISFIVEGT